MRRGQSFLTGTLVLLLGVISSRAAWGEGTKRPSRQEILRQAAKAGESVWRRAQGPDDRLSSRQICTYMVALCEAGLHLDRLPKLIDIVSRMQDRDPDSRLYGNFRWYWSEDRIRDRNAVDFCMRGAALVWQRHRDKLPEPARKKLREMLEYGIEGCLRHRVPTHYTNIALMNALDLILLGEGLDRPDVADEGYTRLDRFCLYTWRWGIHEYCSPTYYGVDIECLLLIEAFCQRERGRRQARALLDLFWTDLALNWYPGIDRLGGACSRDYRYLTGTGYLDVPMWFAGWLSGDIPGGTVAAFHAQGRYTPSVRLRELNTTRFPRLVHQRWGPERAQFRTYYLCQDVGVSTSRANYGWMDLPLTVDLPGERSDPRCYFIPDGRQDPYGKKKIPAGAHSKAHHLRPFWTATQRGPDALGLAVYRQYDLLPGMTTLESHVVMRRDVDGIWVGDRKVDLSGKEPKVIDVKPGQAVVLREGTAGVGVRVVWSRDVEGRQAPSQLVYDGNRFGAIRLTVTHHVLGSPDEVRKQIGEARQPGAALWVRIGSKLADDTAFKAWRDVFASSLPVARADDESVRIEVPGGKGKLVLGAGVPYAYPSLMTPMPVDVVLALDGEDIGREILRDVPPIKTFRESWEKLPSITVGVGEPVSFEAEAGVVWPGMVVAEDPKASGGKFVWLPGEPDAKGGGQGSGAALYRLTVRRAGDYYLWGRVIAPTGEDDSFFVRTASDDRELLALSDWHTGRHASWTWTAMRLGKSRRPTPLTLPTGTVYLEIHPREDGTKLDRLCLTDSAEERPR